MAADTSRLLLYAAMADLVIAVALAVLAVVGRRLPVALRAFLLSLAVVDDLGAILVIAVFYSKGFDPLAFAISVALRLDHGQGIGNDRFDKPRPTTRQHVP